MAIEFKNNIFLLSTADTSYMFRVDRYKHLEHLHYGDRVRIEDGDALGLKEKS